MLNVRDIYSLSYGKMDCTIIKDCLVHRHFCKSRRIGDDEERKASPPALPRREGAGVIIGIILIW